MTSLTITRGVPASGKSHWAKEQEQYGFVRVNRDDLRKELHLKHGQDERLVSAIQHSRVKALLENGIDVIIDDTNLVARYVRNWLKLAREVGATVDFEDFPISYDAAITRDYKRGVEGTGDSVGEEVIKSFFDRFIRKGQLPEVPKLALEVRRQFAPYTHPVEPLPTAYIIDTDGTVARMVDRSPYDPTRYHTDEPIEDVIFLVQNLYSLGHSIIGVSGRDDTYRQETTDWWAKHGVPFDEFYMRPAEDKRKDDIIKDELFEEHIAGRYKVMGVIDDRLRVCRMWNDKGLTVFRVGDPDADF